MTYFITAITRHGSQMFETTSKVLALGCAIDLKADPEVVGDVIVCEWGGPGTCHNRMVWKNGKLVK